MLQFCYLIIIYLFKKANLKMLKKVILFNLESESDVVYFRHYRSSAIPANINQNVK